MSFVIIKKVKIVGSKIYHSNFNDD